MKQLLTLMLLSGSIFCAAQVQPSVPPTLSKLEELSSVNGLVLKREHYLLGTIAKIEFNVLTLTNMASKEVTKGIRLSVKSFTLETYIGYLDPNEVEGLASAMNTIGTSTAEQPENYTEMEYNNISGNIEAGAFSTEKGWKYYIFLGRYNKEQVLLTNTEFLKIAKLLRDARSQL